MYNPVSTYRIQFHKGFTFQDFKQIIFYLQRLGIKTVYASPVFTSRPGSTHGYDSLHPHHINSEIGTEEELRAISTKLKEINMGWLHDIVPNHMAYDIRNPFIEDILLHGRDSEYTALFDIDWDHPSFKGKIMLPVLGSSLDEAIEKGELSLAYENGKYYLSYFENIFPLRAGTTDGINLAKGNSAPVEIVEKINRNKPAVKEIALQQHYVLCHWQDTDYQINYRRFFTINGLICTNVQQADVFDLYHKKIRELTGDKLFNGLRVDHVDGLYDPTQYLERLRDIVGEETYIVVEKILQRGEGLPANWKVQGNTGYDFLAMVNNLFTNASAEEQFTNFYRELVNDDTSIHQHLRDKKALILYSHMGGELDNLYRLLLESGLVDSAAHEQKDDELLKMTIGEFLAQCPVYRYYGDKLPLTAEEQQVVQDVFNRIRKSYPGYAEGVETLEQILLIKPQKGDADYNTRALHFYRRCMQFTGPLMAKGFEDTLMYTYNRFIGHNDVGDSPEAFGMSVQEFHRNMQERQVHWPLSLNATSTHDTKRGEDARARLNVLTDNSEAWFAVVNEWIELNREIKIDNIPDANDEYFIYQALVGTYPMPGQLTGDYEERLQQYVQKAFREAKVHTDWATPDTHFEHAVSVFISKLLDKRRLFLAKFEEFLHGIADYGIVNSLAQVVLKLTCPGVPDIYQGTELWDLSFVDPDNRRPIDYEKRIILLDQLNGHKNSFGALWAERYTGKIKLWLIKQLLHERIRFQDLFEKGEYIPLQLAGRYQNNAMAFARKYENYSYIVVVPLHMAGICTGNDILRFDWEDTKIVFQQRPSEAWEDISTGKVFSGAQEILLNEIFADFPLAILHPMKSNDKRGAGVLLHITSLPSDFGIGDMGPEAKKFADFLQSAAQKYWQVLPLTPISKAGSFSPYSSISGMAGYILLISPELLHRDGLLDKGTLEQLTIPATAITNYVLATANKKKLFQQAYDAFHEKFPEGMPEFMEYCNRESYWLNDFALFVVLKEVYDETPWYTWPEDYKMRNKKALQSFAAEHEQKISKVKWLQFVFAEQWRELKLYCNNKGIKLLGDLPFYVSYDSVDVWSNREMFNLDKEGSIRGVAGVPPDYFSKEGQLWGMPTFNWRELRKQGYNWWLKRLSKNLELFDLLRLDHFRAFAAYWEVRAGEKTAINGKWKRGPGADFFRVVKAKLGGLPFVAEDLGDKMEDVYELRDKVGLPGMKVLQFAFGDNMADSVDIPHNFRNANCVVYTGTHDNNTTVGWFRTEKSREDKRRIEGYTGIKPNENNINDIMIRLAYASIADTVIIPMQDLLGLNEDSRMNTPGTSDGQNWKWRMLPEQLNMASTNKLREWMRNFNRL